MCLSGKHSGIRGQQAAGFGPNVSVLAVVEKHSPLFRAEQSKLCSCSLQEAHHANQLCFESVAHVYGMVTVLSMLNNKDGRLSVSCHFLILQTVCFVLVKYVSDADCAYISGGISISERLLVSSRKTHQHFWDHFISMTCWKKTYFNNYLLL